MTKLTENEKTARALRDLYATRYALSTWGFVWRISFLSIWFVTVLLRIVDGTDPTWLTVLFAVGFTVLSREVWDGFRRRRHERWKTEQLIKEEDDKR